MAANERIQWTFYDKDYQQFAQSSRTQWTPGKATSAELDMNEEKQFRIPTGNRAFDEATNGPVKMARVRVIKLERNTVSDQTVPTLSDPENTTQVNDGENERTAGYDWATGTA